MIALELWSFPEPEFWIGGLGPEDEDEELVLVLVLVGYWSTSKCNTDDKPSSTKLLSGCIFVAPLFSLLEDVINSSAEKA